MATCVMHTAWRASVETSRYLSIFPRILLNVPACLNAKRSTIIHTQKRSFLVLPFGLDLGLVGVSAYFMTRLKRPEGVNVNGLLGPEPGSKESSLYPEKMVSCIAHRGAGLDAPENTIEAFKYCVERSCNFIELDVRSSRDGKLVLLHDQGLERLTGTQHNIRAVDWETIKDLDVGSTHPNRHHFKDVRLCLLSDALDFLLPNKCKLIIDIKGEDKDVVEGVVGEFAARPNLYESAIVTTFNPIVLYQIRKKDPKIIGAMSYRPYCFSAQDYDAEKGPSNPRFKDNVFVHVACRALDVVHGGAWRWAARWCGVSLVLLHKDIVSPEEIHYWKKLGVRCIGWSVNRPLEKLYWRGVLKAPYLANTLLGEPDIERQDADQKLDKGFQIEENEEKELA